MSLTLVAAPRGTRVGFTAAGGAHQQIMISVAPKAWRSDSSKIVAVAEWPARRHHHLVLYETDRLFVTAEHSGLEDLLQRCLSVARRAEGGAVRWDASLLAPDVPPKAKELGGARGLESAMPETADDLLRLIDRLELLTPPAEALHAVRRRSPLHRPLIIRRFLDEVFARMSAVRRGYRPVTATLGAVRGRVDAVSIARHRQTGDPRLVCHFHELTEETPLLAIICAALERVANGRGVRSPFGGKLAESELRHGAVTLRRALGSVTAMPVPTALRTGPRLHLNRLDRPWADALRLALALLAEIEYVPDNAGPRAFDAVELSIETNKLWESIVHKTLVRAGLHPVFDERSQPLGLVSDPWVTHPPGPTLSRPDNVAWRGQDLWVVDAKYKSLKPDSVPSRGDQYQMYAYSHLVSEEANTVEHAVLVYPGDGRTRTWHRGRDSRLPPTRLAAVRIPFPTPQQARTAHAWETYLDAAADAFRTRTP